MVAKTLVELKDIQILYTAVRLNISSQKSVRHYTVQTQECKSINLWFVKKVFETPSQEGLPRELHIGIYFTILSHIATQNTCSLDSRVFDYSKR